MPESEILLTMAEVAVAFAGFTALASVFSGRRTRDHPRQSAVLLRGMIEASLFVVLFALLPLVLERTPLESASIWRVSSAACAACWLGVGALFIRDGLKLKRELGLRVNPWYAAPSLANLILGNAMFLLTATGVISSWAGGAYTVGLLCLLANSAISFARFFFGAYEKLAD